MNGKLFKEVTGLTSVFSGSWSTLDTSKLKSGTAVDKGDSVMGTGTSVTGSD